MELREAGCISSFGECGLDACWSRVTRHPPRSMLPLSLTSFIFPLLTYFTPDAPARSQRPLFRPQPPALQFELRHQHAITPSAHVYFSDIPPLRASANGDGGSYPQSYAVHTRPVVTHKPASAAAFARARTRSMQRAESEALWWDEDEVQGPDTEKRETLLMLAKMTSNAYIAPTDPGWYDLGGNWTVVRARLTDASLCIIGSQGCSFI